MSRRFMVSFAAFSELTNDEKTRTFLAVEIGAGHHEVCVALRVICCSRTYF
jgi:hypothetical protein